MRHHLRLCFEPQKAAPHCRAIIIRRPDAWPQSPQNATRLPPKIPDTRFLIVRAKLLNACQPAYISLPAQPVEPRIRPQPTSNTKPRRDKSLGYLLATAAKLPFPWISPVDLWFSSTQVEVNVTRCYRSRGMRTETARCTRCVLRRGSHLCRTPESGTS